MKECDNCGFNEEGICICWSSNKWYAFITDFIVCPIENKKPENIQALKEYAEWSTESEEEK